MGAYLGACGEVDGYVPAKDAARLVGEDERARLALGVGADAGCEAAGDEEEVLVGDDVDVGSGAGEVNACLEDGVSEADDGRSGDTVRRVRRVSVGGLTWG